MAIGRISGPLLKENLLRDGVNLRFESNLIYLDVNTHANDVSSNPADPSLWTGRVGIHNSNPAFPLDVTGTARATSILGGELDIDEIYINDNTISSQLGDLILSAATASDKVTINSNVLINGNLHATGSITADGSLQLGNEDTDNVVFAADINSNFMPNVTDTFDLGGTDKRWRRITVQSAEIGDVFVENNEISTSLSNGNLILSGNGSGSVTISGPAAFDNTTINGNFTVNGLTDLNGTVNISQTLTVGQTLNVGSVINTDNIRISGNRIETTESNSNLELVANGSGNIDLRENTVITGTLTVSNTVSAPEATIPLINAGQINADQANVGSIEINTNVIKTTVSNSNLELQASGAGNIELLTNTNVTGTLDVSSQATLASANIEDLTSGRVVLAGTSGELEDSANLTFNGTDLSVNGNVSISNNVTVTNDLTVSGDVTVIGNTAQQGNVGVTGTLTVTGDILGGPLRTDDIQIVGNKVETTQSNSDLELDAAGTGTIELLTDANITGTLDVSSQATLASANVEDLTDGRVVLAGTDGELEDNANLTFNGSLLTVTGDVAISNNVSINNNITVSGNAAITGDTTQSGNVTISKNLTVIGDVFAGPVNTDDIRIAGNRIETTQSNSNLELDTVGSGSIELLTDSRVTGTFEVIGNSIFGTTDADTVDVRAEFVSDLVPDATDTYDLGTAAKRWDQLHVVTADIGDVAISGTTVQSTALNSDLYINANGTGNVIISNLLSLGSSGSLSFSGDTVNFNNILIDGDGDYSVIRTLDSNTNLYLDAAGTGTINLTSNTNIVGNLDVTGDITLGGNIRIGDQDIDTVTIVADFTSDLVPDVGNTYDLGKSNKQWRVIHAAEFDNGVININDNVVTTTVSNADLELRANGTGSILVPNNNVEIVNNITISGISYLDDTNVAGDLTVTENVTVNGDTVLNGALTVNGSVTQTGDYSIDGNLTVTKDITTSTVQTDDIRVEGNVITTTLSNSNLQLRANGAGTIELEENTNITGTLDVSSQATLASANIEDLTSGRVVLAGVSGEIEDSVNLTFDGTVLTVTGDQTVTGELDVSTAVTTPVGNITTVNTGLINVDSISISDNTIRTTVSNADLELTPSGTGIVYISGTGAVRIPTGTTSDRPASGEFGYIRYNSQTNNIEAWNGVVFTGISGGSSADANGDTLITFETSGNNEDIIRFFAGLAGTTAGSTVGSNEIMTVSNEGVVVNGTIRIQNNVIENLNSNEDLILRASGTGRVVLDGAGGPGDTGNVFATDPLITLNSAQAGANSYDSGLILERGADINKGIIWDESADEFAFVSTIEQGTVRGNVAIASYDNISIASVKLNSETLGRVTFTDASKIVRSLDTGRSADVGGVMKFTIGSELAIPAGTTAQRPAAPQNASVRYNSDLDYFEGYANNSWQAMGIGFGTAPSYQGFVANGTDFEFSLNIAPLSAAGIIVTINGVVQEPEYAYEVEDDILRFIDESSTVIAPDVGDRIDVRFLSKPAISSVRERSFMGDGSTTTFGMSLPIASKPEVLVFVNNIYQDVEVYSVSGKNVVFIQAPQSDDRINIVHIAGIVAPNVATVQEADDAAIAFAIALG